MQHRTRQQRPSPKVWGIGAALHQTRLSWPPERSTTDSTLLNSYVKQAMIASRGRQPLRLPSLPKCKTRLELLQQGTAKRKLSFSTPYQYVEILVTESKGKLIASAGSIHNLLGAMLGEHADEDFITHILYGYRNMLTPLEFFDFLKSHFDIKPTNDAYSEEECQEWENVVKERVVVILEHWVKNHFYDFKLSYDEEITKVEQELRNNVDSFVIQIRSNEKLAKKSFQLEDLLQETDLSRRLHNGNVTLNHRHNFVRQLLPKLKRSPLPQSRKIGNKKKLCFAGVELLAWVCVEVECDVKMAKGVCGLLAQAYLIRIPNKDRLFVTSDTDFYTFSAEAKEELKHVTFVKPLCIFNREPENFMDIHPVELARQLVLLEFDIFRKITPLELLHQAWTKADTQYLCPNVMKLIDQFNTVSFWVATELINTENKKDRLNVLKRFICIADALRNMKAFNPMMEIVVGLNLGPVSRLTEMWESLPEKYQIIFDSLMNFSSAVGNFRNYRNALRAAEPPCVPYLAVYLKDLTFIADGNPKFMDEKKMILNFERIRMEATIMREIQEHQEDDYPFDKGRSILAFLSSSLRRFSSESELWSKSDALKNNQATLKKQKSTKLNRLKNVRPQSALVPADERG